MEPSVSRRPPRPPTLPSVQKNSESSSSSRPENEMLTNVQNFHDEAYLYVEQALTCDESGQEEQAVFLYEKGSRTIDQALNIHCGSSASGTRIKQMQDKMKKTRHQIQRRIHELKSKEHVAQALRDPPPSYEQSQSPMSDEYHSLGDSIMNDDFGVSSFPSSLNANAEELYRIPDGVQMFFISPEGYVSAPSYPSSLHIFKFIDSETSTADTDRPPAFLKVGSWTYPLIPGTSPVLHSSYGAYMFPDATPGQAAGSAVGVILPDCISDKERDTFEVFIKSLAEVVPESEVHDIVPPTEGERTSTKLAEGLITGAEWISWGLNIAAEKSGILLRKGSEKLRQHIRPDEQAAKVDPRYQQGVRIARGATGTVVKVSSFLVDKLGQATMHLAREAAPHLKKKGEQFLPKSLTTTSKPNGQSKLDGVLEVASGGLQGWATVFIGLERASKTLGNSLVNHTVEVVQHKYGDDAGQLTENAMLSAGNLAITAYNVENLGPKAIAKRLAKDTGKAIAFDADEKDKTKIEKNCVTYEVSKKN